jgi:hypothetical protein
MGLGLKEWRTRYPCAMHAAGPWIPPFEVPDDPRRMCLLHVRSFRTGELRLFLAKHVRSKWVFPDRSWLSNEWEVLRWALVEVPAAE